MAQILMVCLVILMQGITHASVVLPATRSLELVLMVPLSEISLPWTKSINLQHQLEFDGLNYRSTFQVTGLSSSLVWAGAEGMLWRSPEGKRTLLRTNTTQSLDAKEWRVARHENTFSVVSARSLDNAYTYENGRIRSCKAGGAIFTWHRYGSKETLTKRDPTAGNVLVASIMFNGRLQPTEIATNTKTVSFNYDAQGFLKSIVFHEATLRTVSFTYRDSLLAKVEASDGTKREFEWATPRWTEYFNRILPAQPRLSGDGVNTYKCSENAQGLQVEVLDSNGKALAKWDTAANK